MEECASLAATATAAAATAHKPLHVVVGQARAQNEDAFGAQRRERAAEAQVLCGVQAAEQRHLHDKRAAQLLVRKRSIVEPLCAPQKFTTSGLSEADMANFQG